MARRGWRFVIAVLKVGSTAAPDEEAIGVSEEEDDEDDDGKAEEETTPSAAAFVPTRFTPLLPQGNGKPGKR